MKLLPATSICLSLCFLAGCAHQPQPRIDQNRAPLAAENAARVDQLARDLDALLDHPDEETAVLAETAVKGAEALAREYRALYSGKFNNFLILLGIRDRGLCCHWTRDLLDRLDALDLKNFRLFWAVSAYETNQEHSSVVVTAVEQPFESGVVLDAWRYAGELFWTNVAMDAYSWQPHPEDDGRGVIICEADRQR